MTMNADKMTDFLALNNDTDFEKRRENAKEKINRLDQNQVYEEPKRQAFFNQVYENANRDAASVPWADLKAKSYLLQWLKRNNGINLSAIDVACGLGDNAQALANAGYKTTAFDVSQEAVEWTVKRFPNSSVSYSKADIFKLPNHWIEQFDVVHECYTLQALSPVTLEEAARAIASLVKPGGTLLVYTRTREDGSYADGPPWPLQKTDCDIFSRLGFEKISQENFDLKKGVRLIPHSFTHWKKPHAGELK